MNLNNNIQTILNNELIRRKSLNPLYSQRALAKHLKISPSQLNEFLKGNHYPRPKITKQIVDSLNLSEKHKEYLISDSIIKTSRSKKEKAKALDTIQTLSAHMQTYVENTQIVSEPIHYTILEVFELARPPKNFNELAEYFKDVDTQYLKQCFDRLLVAGLLLHQNDTYVPAQDFSNGPDEIALAEIKQYHRNILQRAQKSIENDPIEQRDFTSVILSIDENDMPEAKKAIRIFLNEFTQQFGSEGKNKNDVYQININFFSMIAKKEQ